MYCGDGQVGLSLQLIEIIDETLRRGHRHYRNKEGKLLQHLDQVILAILRDDLQL